MAPPYGHPGGGQPPHGYGGGQPPHGYGGGQPPQHGQPVFGGGQPQHGQPVFGGHAAQPQHYVQQVHQQAVRAAAPDPDRGRRILGFVLWGLGVFVGLILNIIIFIIPAIASPHAGFLMSTMMKAAVVAYIPVALYLFVPWVIDRYDPEPWWALLLVFVWGALMATGFSALINTIVGAIFGSFVGSAMSAPIFEEATKGMAILGVMVFLRREFDGVVDGIIYATFVAIGFAATENIIYYLRGGLEGAKQAGSVGAGMAQIFVLRGILTPWLHPLFTAMTGIGFGLAREHGSTWAKLVFPFLGYCVGVFLHAWWNGLPQIFGSAALVLNLVFGILFALAFFLIICFLVWRKGRIIRRFLHDEVLIGTITAEECDLICSPIGRLRALFSWRGMTGRKFIRAGARLALSKWHTARAMKGQKHTISADFIVPLRQELAQLRQEMEAG